VKKVDNEWTTITSLNTSTLIRKYIDLCKDWIVSNDSIPTQPEQFYNIAPQLDYFEEHSLGLDELTIRHTSEFVCYFCKERKTLDEKKCLTANPFTRLQFMLVCTDCHNKI